jgi:hypothetical protein
MTKLFKNLFTVLASFLLLISITILGVLWTFSNKIPDYKFLKNYKPPVSSKMYSGNGEVVADFSKEKRIFVPYAAIPKNVINSFLAAEDKNFFSHPGIDAKGVIRAIIKNTQNIMSSKRLEGASTITQQVAKNFLLTNEVSLNRKIKEAILAFRIERASNTKPSQRPDWPGREETQAMTRPLVYCSSKCGSTLLAVFRASMVLWTCLDLGFVSGSSSPSGTLCPFFLPRATP